MSAEAERWRDYVEGVARGEFVGNLFPEYGDALAAALEARDRRIAELEDRANSLHRAHNLILERALACGATGADLDRAKAPLTRRIAELEAGLRDVLAATYSKSELAIATRKKARDLLERP